MSRTARLAALRRPSAWRAVATDTAWLAVRHDVPEAPPTWPLTPDESAVLRVLWPKEYGWENAGKWVGPIVHGMREIVEVAEAEIEQPRGNIVRFDVAINGAVLHAAIDYDDIPGLHPEADAVDLLFKLQHRRDGYGRRHVVPGGYVTKVHRLYRLFPRFRTLRSRQEPRFDVYGRFGLRYAAETRLRAMEQLRARDDLDYEGGPKRVVWSEYMREICSARVCLDLPGRGPFCYRLVEAFAVGACVVAPLHATTLHVPLQSGQHIAFAREDLEDLADVSHRYVADPDARRRLQLGAMEYFDRYLRPSQLAGYYLTECLRVAGRR